MRVRSRSTGFPRWLLPLLGVVLAAAVSAAPATARSRHAVSLLLHDAIVKRTESAEGVVITTAGSFRGRPLGAGAIVQRVRPTPLPGVGETTRATFTIFTKRGSLSGTGRSTRTPQPDGTVSVTACAPSPAGPAPTRAPAGDCACAAARPGLLRRSAGADTRFTDRGRRPHGARHAFRPQHRFSGLNSRESPANVGDRGRAAPDPRSLNILQIGTIRATGSPESHPGGRRFESG